MQGKWTNAMATAMRATGAALGLLAGLSSGVALAAENAGTTVSLGAAVLVKQEALLDLDDTVMLLPAITVEHPRFYLRGLEAGVKLLTAPVGLDLLARARLDGWEADDGARLRGLDDRDSALDLGLAVGQRLGSVDWRLTALADVTDTSGGSELSGELGYTLRAGAFSLRSSAALVWWDADLGDYYYGVSDAEAARTSFAAYDVDDSLNVRLGLQGRYALNDRWGLTAGLRVTLLDEAITDSPIVEDETLWSLNAGFSYRF